MCKAIGNILLDSRFSALKEYKFTYAGIVPEAIKYT